MHMRDYAQKAVDMARGHSRQDLDTDEKLAFALTHLVDLIGEAASHVPPELRTEHPAVPWKQIIGTRHRLIHGYDVVDLDILWGTIRDDLPNLLETLNVILGKQP